MATLLQKSAKFSLISLLFLLLVTQWNCAQPVSVSKSEEVSEEESADLIPVDLSLVDDGLDCDTSLDQDCDGVWTDCDADDTDPGILITRSCDSDRDGYADELCHNYADADGDALISNEERASYGFNCDVCPLVADADQADSNADGIGDLCSPL